MMVTLALRTGIGVAEWEKAGPAAAVTALMLLTEDQDDGQADQDAAWADVLARAGAAADG